MIIVLFEADGNLLDAHGVVGLSDNLLLIIGRTLHFLATTIATVMVRGEIALFLHCLLLQIPFIIIILMNFTNIIVNVLFLNIAQRIVLFDIWTFSLILNQNHRAQPLPTFITIVTALVKFDQRGWLNSIRTDLSLVSLFK